MPCNDARHSANTKATDAASDCCIIMLRRFDDGDTMNKALILIPIITLLVLCGLYIQYIFNKPEPTLISRPLPSFNIPIMDTDRYLTPQDMKQGVVLINFFATWCVSCMAEHEQIETLSKTHNIPIYGIGYRDTPKDIKRSLGYMGNPYTLIALDPEGSAAALFGVNGTPHSFLIDADGVIRYQHIGIITDKDIKTVILPMIKAITK